MRNEEFTEEEKTKVSIFYLHVMVPKMIKLSLRTITTTGGIPEMDNSVDLDAPYPVIPKKLSLNNLTCSCQDPDVCQVNE